MSIWKRNRLRVLRAERRLTQLDVAQKLGVSQATYWLWESGHKEPDRPMRSRIARVLQVRVGDLAPDSEAA